MAVLKFKDCAVRRPLGKQNLCTAIFTFDGINYHKNVKYKNKVCKSESSGFVYARRGVSRRIG